MNESKQKLKLRRNIKIFLNILKASLFLFISLLGSKNIYAQNLTIKGTVVEEGTQYSLPGVSISIKGTTEGTISDYDGNFEIATNRGDILIFSYVGYLNQEITIESQTEINVNMKTDLVGLDEVVVIGYGVQKKKLNTGATVNVKGEDIQKQNTVSPIEALKSISPGVTITSDNGVPGSGSKVIIRGTGTMKDASPLYVVDGVAVGNIDFLSPSDIASIDVLKDAASTAIYGSRAANGVILVTTKKGKTESKTLITYDSYFGWQQIAKKPGSVDAKTYMELIEEAYTNDGREIDWEKKLDSDDWEKLRDGTVSGTNWLEEMYNENAPTQSHALGITGGSSKSSFAMGLSYLEQQGIIGFPEISTYNRLNARLNSDHILVHTKQRSLLKMGQNLSYSNFRRPNIATGNMYYNDLHNAIVTNPLLPMYADENTPEEYGVYHEPIPLAPLTVNPVGLMDIHRKNSDNDNNNLVGNVYLELLPINNLVLRTSYGFDGSFSSSRSYTPIYQLGAESFSEKDYVSQNMNQNYTWTISNTASYKIDISGIHNLTAMIGHESRKTSKALYLGASNDSSIYKDWDHAYLSNTHSDYSRNRTGIYGGDAFGYAMLSYFGRISYDYNETLLATLVYRADASNNLAPGHQWGDFWSGSIGYILSNNEIFASVPALTYLKLRGGWGQNGNERIGAFQYNAGLVNSGGSAFFGLDKSKVTTGFYPKINPNPSIAWETSEQLNFGLDANFLEDRFQLTLEWYTKTTKDWLVDVPKPMSNGTQGAVENGGAVNNKGVELSLSWSEQLGEFKYRASINGAYNKNEVTELATENGYFNGPANIVNQGSSPVNRVEVGYPIGYFRGYETNGVIQEGEENQYVKPDTLDADGNPIPYFKGQRAGDFIFVDQNGDGKINDDDKVMIGNPVPDVTIGINLSAEYKGAYVNLSANGAFGHQIIMSYRPSSTDNFTEYHLGRWTSTNPSNSQPRLSVDNSHRNYTYVSDYYIHNGDYLRISNITIGYDVNRFFNGSPFEEAKLYFSGQNLFTFSKYQGMNPEVGYGADVSWGSGVDLGLYPKSKTYLIGLNVKF